MRLALITAIVIHIAVMCVVLVWRKPPTIVHEQTTIPLTINVPLTVQPPPTAPQPAATPVPVTNRPQCPSPRTDAPRATTLHPPDNVHGVVASRTNAGWIAAWDDTRVLVSTDAGATFERVLDGPGFVKAVEFDCFGTVVALRDDQLGIREGTREHWQRVPGLRNDDDGHAVLIGGGPDVIVISVAEGDTWKARLAASPDRGGTWWYRDLVNYWESAIASGYEDTDGTIRVALTTADCMSDPVYWFRIRNGKVETDELGSVGHIVLDGDRAYISAADGGIQTKRFGEESWHATKSKRGKLLLSGSVDAAGRLWSIDETKDGESSWAVAGD